MARGNKNQFDEINELKRKKSIGLIKQAAEFLKSIGDELTINNMVRETIRLDPLNKGISKSSFQSKKLAHIQEAMQIHGIGKYGKLAIYKPANEIDIDDIIKIVKDNKKLQKANKQLKESKKTLQEEHIVMQKDIKLLRGKCIELEMRYRLKTNMLPVNRNI